MLGIEKLKEQVTGWGGLANAAAKAAEDGKISWVEVIGLAPQLMGVPSLLKDASEAGKEWADLSQEERTEITAHVEDILSFGKEKAEKVAEIALAIAANVGALISAVKA